MVTRFLSGILILGILAHAAAFAQQMRSTTSKRIVLQYPVEREILGRDFSDEAERCYEYINRVTDNGLPRNITVALDWNVSGITWNFRAGLVTIGMNNPEALADTRKYLRHNIPYGIARLGLINISQGAQREDTEFLFEGMAEIITHEYNHSSRSLDVVWATAKLLDETGQLGFSRQRAWSEFAGGKKNHRNAAPGITFLLMQREIDRSRLMKFFEALRKNSILNALNQAFKAPAADLEATWRKRVRSYEIPDEITVQNDDAPVLLSTAQIANPAPAGQPVRLDLFIKDPSGDIYPETVFVRDSHSGKTFQSQKSALQDDLKNDALTFSVVIPVEDDRPAGNYSFQVIMIDDLGNLRQSRGTYLVTGDR